MNVQNEEIFHENYKYKLGLLNEISRDLAEWQGAIVQLWEYGISHSRLELRIERTNEPGNLHIRCLDCRSISAPVVWHNASLQVSLSASREDPVFVLYDSEVNATIICGRMDVFKDVNFAPYPPRRT